MDRKWTISALARIDTGCCDAGRAGSSAGFGGGAFRRGCKKTNTITRIDSTDVAARRYDRTWSAAGTRATPLSAASNSTVIIKTTLITG
jgi:hypothetical protein